MPLQLFAHPFSSYSQKVLTALYEAGTPFDYRLLGPDDPATGEEWARLWPLKRMPVLVDGGRTVLESTAIVEYLAVHHPGAARLIPGDPDAAVDARMMDRVFDNYVMTPMQKVVFNALRPEPDRDAYGVREACALLEAAYAWLDGALRDKEWAAGDSFTLADCAAAPALFYADWVHEIGRAHVDLRAYRMRLMARPSFARAVAEARPYRHLFPLGAPERD